MIKNGNQASKITPFNFSSFEVEGGDKLKWETFEIPELTGESVNRVSVSPKVIRAEREAETKSNFRVDDIVRDLRGLSGQEKNDFESSVSKEVEDRIKKLREDAYREGLERGRAEGSDAALKQASVHHQRQVQEVETIVQGLRENYQQLLHDQRHDLYEMTKRMLKWLVLKEVKADDYLGKLLEKLILEMNQKQNILVRVNPADFASMPQVLELIQQRLGSLTNVRVEPDQAMNGRGIILETDNGIIDATPEAMFETLDKLFETVVNHGGE